MKVSELFPHDRPRGSAFEPQLMSRGRSSVLSTPLGTKRDERVTSKRLKAARLQLKLFCAARKQPDSSPELRRSRRKVFLDGRYLVTAIKTCNQTLLSTP